MALRKSFAVAVVLAALGVEGALAGGMPAGVQTGDSKMGPVLTDTRGMTLYFFDKDTPGKSTCYGKCAEAWPPLTAPVGASTVGDFSVVKRDDGAGQWAYRGKPLYGWVRDGKPGDTTGHRFRDVWTVAQP